MLNVIVWYMWWVFMINLLVIFSYIILVARFCHYDSYFIFGVFSYLYTSCSQAGTSVTVSQKYTRFFRNHIPVMVIILLMLKCRMVLFRKVKNCVHCTKKQIQIVKVIIFQPELSGFVKTFNKTKLLWHIEWKFQTIKIYI